MFSYKSTLARSGKGAIGLFDSENWYLNNQITKGPAKGVFTRQKDVISDNSRITNAIAESGSRASESILIFPRGINPMVSMQFTNSDGRPSKLPRVILRDGAFRPPIRSTLELTPLSRIPFGPYSVYTPRTNQPNNSDRPANMIPTLAPSLKPDVTRNDRAPAPEAPRYITFNRLDENISLGDVGTNKTALFFENKPKLLPALPPRVTTSTSAPRSRIESLPVETPAIDLVRNLPAFVYASNSADSTVHKSSEHPIPSLNKNIPEHTKSTNRNTESGLPSGDASIPDLERNMPAFTSVTNRSTDVGLPSGDASIPDLERNLPAVSRVTNRSTETGLAKGDAYIPDLERNLPAISRVTNRSTDAGLAKGDANIPSLERNLPEFSQTSNRSTISNKITSVFRTLLKTVLPTAYSTNRTDGNFNPTALNQIPQLAPIEQYMVTTTPQGYKTPSLDTTVHFTRLKDKINVPMQAPKSHLRRSVAFVEPKIQPKLTAGEMFHNVPGAPKLNDINIKIKPRIATRNSMMT